MISRKAPLRHSPVDREAIESWLDRPPRVRGPNLVARGRSRREAQFQIHRFTATATRTDCLAFETVFSDFHIRTPEGFSIRCHRDGARVADLARRAAHLVYVRASISLDGIGSCGLAVRIGPSTVP